MRAGVIAGGLLSLCLSLTACDPLRLLGYGYGELDIAPGVYALEDLNSPYDDYNAGPPPEPYVAEDVFLYASQAESRGQHFDLHKGRFLFVQEAPRGADASEPPTLRSQSRGLFEPGLTGIAFNSDANEYGPIFLSVASTLPRGRAITEVEFARVPDFEPGDDDQLPTDQDLLAASAAFVFSSDREGQRDLWVYNPSTAVLNTFGGNSSAYNEAYLSYDPRREMLYFSSDRSGQYQIYQLKKPAEVALADWLLDPEINNLAQPAPKLNADGDTTCPYLFGDWMVLASNRKGGKGGYDLYYSRYQNGSWQTPNNLQALFPEGVRLNSAADEFRPALLASAQKTVFPEQKLLVFSSNRDGGKGGYDLYLAPLPNDETKE